MTYRRPTNLSGSYTGLPTPGVIGRVYLCTDGPLSFYDNGLSWDPIRIDSQMTATPSITTLSQINAGGRYTFLSNKNGGIVMEINNPAAADDIRLAVITAPTPPYSFTIRTHLTLLDANFSYGGIIWREYSSGKISMYGFGTSGSSQDVQVVVRYETANNNGTSPTYTFNTDRLTLVNHQEYNVGDGCWLRLTDDGVNRIYYFSSDGVTWMSQFSQSRTQDLTPDQIGIWVSNIFNTGSGGKVNAFFSSWNVESFPQTRSPIVSDSGIAVSSRPTVPLQLSSSASTMPNGNFIR